MKTLTVKADVQNLSEVLDFISAQLEAVDCPMKPMTQLLIASEEIFANIAHYAYGEATGEATICIDVGECVAIEFVDSGAQFNPLEALEPDISMDAEERQIGGLGIFLVKKTMSAVAYRYVEGKNRLRIEKWLVEPHE